MKPISIQSSEISSAIAIAFCVFVLMTVVLLLIFKHTRKKLDSYNVEIKRIVKEITAI